MESEKNGPQNAIAVCQLSFFFRIFIHLAGSSLSIAIFYFISLFLLVCP
jgi:hypothetical protein